MDSMMIAGDLGTVLGSEKVCGLTYDQDAISVWIDNNTDASDMGFAGTLSMMTQGAEFQLRSLSESARTAHCRAVSRTAQHYGFIKG